jgi:hypothetical protein
MITTHSRALLVAGAVAGLVAGSVGVTTVAAADPPGLDPPSCATTLARVHSWPGQIVTADGPVSVYSDAFESYLSSLPACSGVS